MVRHALPLLVLTGLAGCAHAPAGAPPAPLLAQPASTGREEPTGAEVERILAGSGLAYVTVEEARKWAVPFAGTPRTVVWVVHGPKFTLVMGKLFTVQGDAGVDLYKALARRNYDLDQVKLSIDEEGTVFASYEVPTRILDRTELLEDVYGVAGAIQAMRTELAPLVDPDALDATPDPLPEPQRSVGVPLLEVRRGHGIEEERPHPGRQPPCSLDRSCRPALLISEVRLRKREGLRVMGVFTDAT